MTDAATVLIVGPDRAARRYLDRRLAQAGYRTLEAPSSEKAIEAARAESPDAVLADAALSDDDVTKLCRQMRAAPELSDVPVVLVFESDAAPDAADRARSLGADGAAAASLSDDELLTRIRSFLPGLRPPARPAVQPDYRAVFEDAPIGIYRTTPEGEIVMANQALIEMLGYETFDELGQRDLKIDGYHPDYPRSEFKERMEEDGQVRGLEAAWRRKDDSTLFVRESARAVRDADGNVIAYQGSVEDVTESVLRTRRLERLNAVLDAIRDVNQLIVRVKEPARLIDQACRLLVETRGYRTAWIALMDDGTPRHVAQAGFDELPDDVIDALAEGELHMCGTDALSLGGVCLTGEPADGRLATLYAGQRLMAIRLEHAGSVFGLMSVSLPPDIPVDDQEQALFEEVAGDIAFALHTMNLEEQRTAASRALRESEERYRVLFESTGTATCVLGDDGLIRVCNAEFGSLIGRTREEIEGAMRWTDFVAEEDQERVRRFLARRVPEPKAAAAERAFTVVRSDGARRHVYLQTGTVEETGERITSLTDVTALKRAEDALRENQANLSALIENTDGSIWSVDREGRLIVGNSVFHRNVKDTLDRRLAPGEDVLKLDNGLAPTVAEWRRYYDRALAGERFSVEAERHVDGGPRFVEYRFNPIQASDGTVVGATIYGRDVTERHRAAEEIRERSAQLEAVRDVGLRITAELDLEPLLRSIATRATELFDSIGGGLYLVRPDGNDQVLEWSVPVGSAPEPGQTTLRRGEGLAGTVWELGEALVVDDYQSWERRSEAWNRYPVRGAVGAPVRWGNEILGVLSLHTDTPRAYSNADARLLDLFADQAAIAIRNARLYEETRRLASFNEDIIRSMAEGIVIEDTDGVLTLVNPAGAELLGYEPDDLVGQPRETIVPPDQRARLEAVDAAVEQGERELFELELLRKDGTRMPALLSGAPRFDAEGQFAGTLVVYNDITEQREAELELSHRAEHLRRISDLAADLASAPSSDAFFRLLAKELREISGGLFVAVSSYDADEQALTVEHVVGEGPLLARATEYLGGRVVGLKTPVDEDVRAQLLREGVGTRTDLAETTFGAVPKPAARALQKALGIDHFVGLAFTARDQLLGTAVVVSRTEHTHPSPEVLRVFARVTAAALRQRQAEKALRESEERFRMVLENLPGGVFAHDLEGRIVLVNEAASRNTGYTREELMSMAVADIDPTSQPRGDADTLWHNLETGGSTSLETAHIRKDGSQYPADVRLSAVTLQGRPIILAVAFDISERKRAEQALKESEERFRALIESAPVSILLLRDGRYIYGNPASADLLGYDSPREIEGLDALQTIAPEFRPLIKERMSRIAARRDNEPIEVKLVKATGEPCWAMTTSVSIQMDGEPTAVIVGQDITERKRAEEELRRLGAAVEQSTEGFLFTDMEGRILYANRIVEELYGYPLDDLIGDSVFSLNASPGDTEAMRTHLLETGSWTGEVEQRRQDGSTFPALVSLFTVTDESGDVDSAVVAVRDITEEQRMEEQLRQQERLAAVGQLAGGIAHDFNNILAAIILYTEMPLGQPSISPRTRNALETILEESHRAADLIQQILDFSRSAMMDTETIDLVDLVEETASLLRRTIPENIDMLVEAPAGACTVEADRTRIHQALMNLALNAKDAMPTGGELRMIVESLHVSDADEPPLRGMGSGEWARVTVSDTGTGMTEEVQDHLFEPFFTTKEQGKGTGLGLAQVYGIVKQHEGFINVETVQGEGTTFTIYLPAEETAPEDDRERPRGPKGGRGETILVVEDAEGLRGAIRAGLSSVGYRVLTAAHGREALDKVIEHEIDLVLTDVVMPEMGGEALMRRLRQERPELQIVAMTGHVMDKDVHQLHASGFSAALPKPFSIEELTDVVRSVLDR